MLPFRNKFQNAQFKLNRHIYSNLKDKIINWLELF